MKRIVTLLSLLLMTLILITGCSNKTNNISVDKEQAGEVTPGSDIDQEAEPTDGFVTLNIYASNSDIRRIIDKYQLLHPDFVAKYKVNIVEYNAIDTINMLKSGLEENKVDLYSVEELHALEFTQGEYATYAASYKEFGIDVEKAIKEAEIAQYSIDIGTRPSDGEVVGLGYQSHGGAFIYRRSIAKDVWGYDEPNFVASKIGAGTKRWEDFFQAASDLADKGYAIVSSADDIWKPYVNTSSSGWFVDGELNLDLALNYMKLVKELKENGYTNNTRSWEAEWFADMKGEGERPVFGFYGPLWFVDYVLIYNCGDTYGDWAVCEPNAKFYWGGTCLLGTKKAAGDPVKAAGVAQLLEWITLDSTENGLQYMWAKGSITDNVHEAAMSAKVMKQCSYQWDILGGQDAFPVFVAAFPSINCNNYSKDDEKIYYYWRDQFHQYMDDTKTFEDTMADFKKKMVDYLGLESY